MENKSYVIYKTKPGRKGEDYHKAVKKGLQTFLNNEKRVDKNLPKDEARNSGNHIECSYLNHGIWTKLMENVSNNKLPYSANYFWWAKEADEERMLFHFDIMNNPKSCGLSNLYQKEKGNDGLAKWKSSYHSVGNMTPIPWFKIDGNHYIDGQQLHKSLDERWDLYLKFLKDNWNLFNKNKNMTFEKYIFYTCQQMYFEDIYNQINIEQIDKLSVNDINKWKINCNSKIINFSDLNEEVVVETINNLIMIRNKVIFIKLKSILEDNEI